MKFQSSQSSCGPASLSNALKALGKDVHEHQVTKFIKATGSAKPEMTGTTAEDLTRAANKWARVSFTGFVDDATALQYLRSELVCGKVAILGVDHSTHWVAAIGMLGYGRFLVADPANEELVLSLTPEELRTRWLYHNEFKDTYECEIVVIEGRSRK